MAIIRIFFNITKHGHHAVLKPINIPAYAIIKDRNVNLNTQEIHECISLQSENKKSFDLYHYIYNIQR